VERLYPSFEPGLDPLSIYDDLELPAGCGGRPYVGINMVTSIDGKITVGGGHQKVKLGSAVDRGLMERIRTHFDGVLRGAETVRANPYFPGAPESAAGKGPRVAIVVSGSLDLPLDSEFFAAKGGIRIVLTTEASDPGRRERLEGLADVLVCGERRVDLDCALSILRREYGVERLLVEGGASVNYWFIGARLVDTLFCTLAPKLCGYAKDLTMIEGPQAFDPVPRLRLASLFHHEDELFFRWTVA